MSTDFLAALDAEIAALRQALKEDVRFVRLTELKRVRALYADDGDQGEREVRTGRPVVLTTTYYGNRPPVRRASPERTRAIDAARMYIVNRSGPVPTADVFRHLQSLGIAIRGENPHNNLSAMLSNSGLFKSNGRAGWTIRGDEDGDDEGDEDEPSADDRRDERTDHDADDPEVSAHEAGHVAIHAGRISPPPPPPHLLDTDDEEDDTIDYPSTHRGGSVMD